MESLKTVPLMDSRVSHPLESFEYAKYKIQKDCGATLTQGYFESWHVLKANSYSKNTPAFPIFFLKAGGHNHVEMSSLYEEENSVAIIKGNNLSLGEFYISRPFWNHSFLSIFSPFSLVTFPHFPFFVQPDFKVFGFHYHFLISFLYEGSCVT